MGYAEMKAEVIERRQIQLKLISLGQYSKALILTRWWVRLNDAPEVVQSSLSLGVIGIEPVPMESEKQEAGHGMQ